MGSLRRLGKKTTPRADFRTRHFVSAFLVPGLVVYFALHRSRTAFITASCIAALPFSLMFVPFSFEVAASMWRTRMSNTGSERIY